MQETPIQKIFPKADNLLQTPKEQLAPILLKLAKAHYQQAGFIPDAVGETVITDGYPGHRRHLVQQHLSSVWNWIEREGLIEPAPGINGRNGWRMLTPEGEEVVQGVDLDAIRMRQGLPRALLHSEVRAKCEGLFAGGHYEEAIEKSFKVVRDRLRDLTGNETGSDAFGKTNIHIKGALVPNSDENFNQGVKHLLMAIDRFRNEKAHTSESGTNDPIKALQYLVLSSLAMRFLDNAEILP